MSGLLDTLPADKDGIYDAADPNDRPLSDLKIEHRLIAWGLGSFVVGLACVGLWHLASGGFTSMVGFGFRVFVLYFAAWAVLTLIPALVWSELRPKKFLKIERRLIACGLGLFAVGLVLVGLYGLLLLLAPIIKAVAYAVLMVVAAIILLVVALVLLYIALVLAIMAAAILAAIGYVYLLYKWAFATFDVAGALLRWDVATLGSLWVSYLLQTCGVVLPPVLYAAWKTYQHRREMEELQRRRASTRWEPPYSRLPVPKPVPEKVEDPPPPPEPELPRTVMEAMHPEIVAQVKPALPRPDSRLVRRDIPKAEDRPETVTWDADDESHDDSEVTAFAESLKDLA